MKVVTLFLLVLSAIAVVGNENITETTTTTDTLITTNVPTTDNATVTTGNQTSEDMPMALALQRLRREPPLTVYKHRIRVSRRKPRPRRRNKGHRPVYGPPKYRPPPPPPIKHHKPPPHFESDESPDGYSYSPTKHKPRDSYSHSALDVSSDFNIQSIPAADFGVSKESYEDGPGDSYDDEVIPFQKQFINNAKTALKKQKNKQYRVKFTPQAYDIPSHHSPDNVRFSYEPPAKSVEYDSHAFSDEVPGYSFGHKPSAHGKHKKQSSYHRGSPPKSNQIHNKGHGYSYDTPNESHDSIGSISSYAPPSKQYKTHQEIPDYSHSFPTDLQEDHESIYKHDPSIDTSDHYQKETGYSYKAPGKSHAKDEQQGSYQYVPSKLPYKPHETYGVPPKPPSSSYGYPVLSPHSPSIENVHNLQDIPSKDLSHFSYNPSPPGSLFDLPSQSSSSEVFGKHPASDYLPPDSSYSFTTNSNAYNLLPTEGAKHVPGNFAEPPSHYKPEFSKPGLSTSHFPLDQDHLSSNYGSPKSSYEVPIYDAVPFTTPAQEHYPPSLPTSYSQNGFENVARGSNKLHVSTPLRNRNNKLNLANYKSQSNALPASITSSEESSESTLDYLEQVIENQIRKKRKNKRKQIRDPNRYIQAPSDQDGAFSSQPEVRVLPTRSVLSPTISTVLNNTSNYSKWTPLAPTRQTSSGHNYDNVSIDKSHSINYYGGLAPPGTYFGSHVTRKRDDRNPFRPSKEISEVSLQSPKIFVSDKKVPAGSEKTRKGAVFDESLSYWEKNPLPPNHKLH